MAKAVKLADIAARVGVSTVTVSKALSNQKGVSEDMRTKIKLLADELGYVPLSETKRSRENKSYNIGVVVSARFFNQSQSFYWLMYQELAKKAPSRNCFTMLEVVSEEDEKAEILPRILKGGRIDGLVVIGKMKTGYLKQIEINSKVPVVYMDFYDKETGKDAVVSNNYFGMYKLTDHLCKLGHTQIAYVGTLFTTDSITDRYFGYCKALKENNIDLRYDYVIDDRFRENGSKEGFKYSLPSPLPTAFVCNCDITASEIINEVKKQGLRVPEDVSVVGYDDYVFPSLGETRITTYSVDMKEMASRILKIMNAKLAGDNTEKGISIVEGKMILGDTSGPVRRK